jgi:hypothetical protein
MPKRYQVTKGREQWDFEGLEKTLSRSLTDPRMAGPIDRLPASS